jgi:hypothetical protein
MLSGHLSLDRARFLLPVVVCSYVSLEMVYRSFFNKRCFHLSICAFKKYPNWYYFSYMNRHPGSSGPVLTDMSRLVHTQYPHSSFYVSCDPRYLGGSVIVITFRMNKKMTSVHCQKLGKCCTEMISGENSLRYTQVSGRFCCFTEG